MRIRDTTISIDSKLSNTSAGWVRNILMVARIPLIDENDKSGEEIVYYIKNLITNTDYE